MEMLGYIGWIILGFIVLGALLAAALMHEPPTR